MPQINTPRKKGTRRRHGWQKRKTSFSIYYVDHETVQDIGGKEQSSHVKFFIGNAFTKFDITVLQNSEKMGQRNGI